MNLPAFSCEDESHELKIDFDRLNLDNGETVSKDYWVYIYEANRNIVKNPNAIKIGTKLRIPKLAPELIDATNPETIEYARYLHDVYVRR